MKKRTKEKKMSMTLRSCSKGNETRRQHIVDKGMKDANGLAKFRLPFGPDAKPEKQL